MRRAPLAAVTAAAGLAAALGGCVSLKRTPEARFFVLRPLAEPAAAPAAAAASGVVGVLTARLPPHLDRPQLVTWTAPGELEVDEFVRWGEPLDMGVTRTTVENLAALLPQDRVVRAPWPAASALRCRVAIDVTVFGAQPDGTVRLEGRWAVLPALEERPLARAPFKLSRDRLAGGGPGASVEAMSELLADLSREIAAAVRVVEPVPVR